MTDVSGDHDQPPSKRNRSYPGIRFANGISLALKFDSNLAISFGRIHIERKYRELLCDQSPDFVQYPF